MGFPLEVKYSHLYCTTISGMDEQEKIEAQTLACSSLNTCHMLHMLSLSWPWTRTQPWHPALLSSGSRVEDRQASCVSDAIPKNVRSREGVEHPHPAGRSRATRNRKCVLLSVVVCKGHLAELTEWQGLMPA